MPAPAAAYYIGISESKLRTLPIHRLIDGGNRNYDIRDLDAWVDNLRSEGDTQSQPNSSTDDAFGIFSK